MWIVATLYRFMHVPNPSVLAARLRAGCAENNVCGTLIVAREGINGTIAAPDAQKIDAVLAIIRESFPGLELKMSGSSEKPFQRLKIKVKPEIVTMRCPGIDPTKTVGTYVEAKDWNDLIADSDTLVIDTRNAFEFEKGTFEGARNPNTTTFWEFPEFVEKNLDPAKHKKIAMFCTGGIRCEKASSLLVERGFEKVYHLKGGILKYLETVPESQSRWRGRCFVFDERESLGHGLENNLKSPLPEGEG